MIEWRVIQEFPNYSVSDSGDIRHDRLERIVKPRVNNYGLFYVGLVKKGVQQNRSVALLVANAFLMTARSLSFDTPINLDGDRGNNKAANLQWRPRWFAREYIRQFHEKLNTINSPIQEEQSKAIFEGGSWEASTTFGLLNRDLVMSVYNQSRVWPTYQRFHILK